MPEQTDKLLKAVVIKSSDDTYPKHLVRLLGKSAPTELFTLGNLDLLMLPKTALFCSARYPGEVILRTYDQATKWRDAGRCVISGFHSPVEKECLRILLRGSPPIILCPARAIPKRISADWQKPIVEGRMLILSAFSESENRPTKGHATRRNEIVAALADEAWFVYITSGGKSDCLRQKIEKWNVPIYTISRHPQ